VIAPFGTANSRPNIDPAIARPLTATKALRAEASAEASRALDEAIE